MHKHHKENYIKNQLHSFLNFFTRNYARSRFTRIRNFLNLFTRNYARPALRGSPYKSAFSLIELSIVILVIGVIMAGVVKSTRLLDAYRLEIARNLTKTSPVNSINGLLFWLESTSVSSFSDAETEDGYAVSTWYDINPTSTAKYNATASGSAKPTYTRSCINNLPCLTFDGTNDAMANTSLITTIGEFTIFAVINTDPSIYTGSYFSYFFATTYSTYTDGRIMFLINVGADSSCYINYYGNSTAVSTNLDLDNFSRPFLIKCYEQNNVKLSHNINGTENSNTSITNNGTKNILGYSVGDFKADASTFGNSNFNGKIGEIIFFNRYLKAEERNAVEEYLAKKWGINL